MFWYDFMPVDKVYLKKNNTKPFNKRPWSFQYFPIFIIYEGSKRNIFPSDLGDKQGYKFLFFCSSLRLAF